MADTTDPKFLDKRTQERYVRGGQLDEKAWERHIKGLPDVIDKGAAIDTRMSDVDADYVEGDEEDEVDDDADEAEESDEGGAAE